MTASEAPHEIEVLSTSQCWAMVRSNDVGRLGVVVDGRPEIFPINYVVDQGTLVFRTARGTKLDAALSTVHVAFETDGYHAAANMAWSVAVKGCAEQISSGEDVLASSRLPLFSWQGGEKNNFVRINPVEITGRRFRMDPKALRTPGISDAGRMDYK